MTGKTECSICSGPTTKVSATTDITKSSNLNWESDSTLRLLGWESAQVQLRFCTTCFHSIIHPKFDANLLYGARGSKVRKSVFESYFPGEKYEARKQIPNLDEAFEMAGRVFLRLHQVAFFVSKNSRFTSEVGDKITILDWGGGDGFISSVYASALSAVSGATAENFVHDLTDWKGAKSQRAQLQKEGNEDEYDVIMFSHVLEHSHDPVGIIKSALPNLKPEGLIICEVPDERINIAAGLAGHKFGLHYHVAHFSRRSMHSTLERSGLDNIHTVYQKNSSYRGDRRSCLLGIGQKGRNEKAGERKAFFLGEVIALFALTIKYVSRKSLAKFVSLFGFGGKCQNNYR